MFGLPHIMMSSQAVSNFGTKLQVELTPLSGEYTTIGEARMIPAPQEEQDDIEVTHHSSIGYREYKPSKLKDQGELAVVVNSVPTEATQSALKTLHESGDERQFRIVRPNGIVESFGAYIKSIVSNDADAQSPEAVQDTITFRLSGSATRTINTELAESVCG